MRAPAAAALALVGAAALLPAQRRADHERFSFVVLGHVRGTAQGLNPKLGELLDAVRELKPDLVLLTGDMIWGDYDRSGGSDSATVEREWNALDSALATLGAPVHRVPGNHDISDLASREIYVRRYGPIPQAVRFRDSKFLLLASTWIPADGDRRVRPYILGVDFDSGQVAFLRRELADTTAYAHAFALFHHLMWWQPDSARYWREVHPIFAAGRVAAVFSGDYGPMKFSHTRRDGVAYYQTAIEDFPSVEIQRGMESSRVLSSQFDNFLHVVVDGPRVAVRVRTIAEVSSGRFSPDTWRAIFASGWRPPLYRRVWNLIGSPRRLVALGLGLGAVFGAGAVAGVRWARRRAAGR